MYLIVGLGNPEPDYASTRHNMGFDTINKLAQKHSVSVTKQKFHALYGTGKIQEEKVIFVKPQTYMNLSGTAVREYMAFYKIKPENLIVVYDDMDIEKGIIKIRKTGGPGSHNGMKSVISQIQTQSFIHVRIGIGRPEFLEDKINYVIGRLNQQERQILEKATNQAALSIETIIMQGIDRAMNQFN